jgi:acyl-CoA synthetase (AMP-forming)/AMP-acid ligase II
VTAGTIAESLDLRAGTDGKQQGEILTRGPELFTGYADPALNAAALLPVGWFRTGDIGRIDAGGHLTVTDRLKDIIISGGENISSKEVEDPLRRHGRRLAEDPRGHRAGGPVCHPPPRARSARTCCAPRGRRQPAGQSEEGLRAGRYGQASCAC